MIIFCEAITHINTNIALSPKGKEQDFDSCICWFESNQGCDTLADEKKKAPRYRKCGDWGMRPE